MRTRPSTPNLRFATLQVTGRLGVRLALEVAEQHGQPVFLGKPRNLFVENAMPVVARIVATSNRDELIAH